MGTTRKFSGKTYKLREVIPKFSVSKDKISKHANKVRKLGYSVRVTVGKDLANSDAYHVWTRKK